MAQCRSGMSAGQAACTARHAASAEGSWYIGAGWSGLWAGSVGLWWCGCRKATHHIERSLRCEGEFDEVTTQRTDTKEQPKPDVCFCVPPRSKPRDTRSTHMSAPEIKNDADKN